MIKIDQKSLKYMTDQRLAEGIQHKLMKLLEYSYSIEYKKGKDNITTNALSRRVLNCMATITSVIPLWTEEVEKSYEQDEHCKQLLEQLSLAQEPDSLYTLHSGVLRYKGRIYVGKRESTR